MLQNQFPNQQTQKSYRKVIFIVVACLLLVIFLTLISRESYEQRRLNITPLQASLNHGFLLGSDIYLYNGAEFQKINVENSEKTTLSTGRKIPNVSRMHWSPFGAMINFNSSFLLSEVHTKIVELGEKLDASTRNYTWYLDFNSGNLQLVDKLPINHNQVVYSDTDDGFYFVTTSADQENREIKSSLKFYSTVSNNTSSLISNLGLADISHIDGCPGYTVCLIGRPVDDISSERIYALNDNSQLQEIHNSDGRIFNTNLPGVYVVVSSPPASTSEGEGIPEEVGYSNEPAKIYRTETSTTHPLGFDVGDAEIVLSFVSDNEYLVFDDQLQQNISSDTAFYRAGKLTNWLGQPVSQVVPLMFSDGTKLADNLTPRVSFGLNGDVLVNSFSNNQLLFSNKQNIPAFSTLNRTEAENMVEQCSKTSQVKEFDFFTTNNTFRVYFTNDSQFKQNVESFSSCISSTNTLGYNYYFGALDPSNGRIVTD